MRSSYSRYSWTSWVSKCRRWGWQHWQGMLSDTPHPIRSKNSWNPPDCKPSQSSLWCRCSEEKQNKTLLEVWSLCYQSACSTAMIPPQPSLLRTCCCKSRSFVCWWTFLSSHLYIPPSSHLSYSSSTHKKSCRQRRMKTPSWWWSARSGRSLGRRSEIWKRNVETPWSLWR